MRTLKITVADESGQVLDTKSVEVEDNVKDVTVITDSDLNYVCPELCNLTIKGEDEP